jgi:hypothetical protein
MMKQAAETLTSLMGFNVYWDAPSQPTQQPDRR